MQHILRRSPFFYVGDKYKLLRQLVALFPFQVNNFYEPFVGGGSVFLNIQANKYHLNDADRQLIDIHRMLVKYSRRPEIFWNRVEKLICEYDLSRSYKEDVIPKHLKVQFKKTYFARFNKSGYGLLREEINKAPEKDPFVLYVLLIYGFNRMLRFNQSGQFNLPVGNVDFNNNVVKALKDYFVFVRKKNVQFTSLDFRRFLTRKKYHKNDFIYLDPPYLITFSEYNKFWDKKNEEDLFGLVDSLAQKGVKFALSNVTHYKGRTNEILIKWMRQHQSHVIHSNYISYHNNSQKKITEVLVTNYEPNK